MAKVLIIDDDIASSQLIKTLLELDGLEATICIRGSDAMNQANALLPDVFLIDYHLDDRSGVELVQVLRKTGTFAQTPIIMASGRDVSTEAYKAGADVFLIKPYEPEELTKSIFALMKKSND